MTENCVFCLVFGGFGLRIYSTIIEVFYSRKSLEQGFFIILLRRIMMSYPLKALTLTASASIGIFNCLICFVS